MKKKSLLCALLAAALCLSLAGCQTQETTEREKVSLIIKTPPIGLGSIPGMGEAEVYDMLTEAAEHFQAQYDKYDVEFSISRYDYLDEQSQLADKYGTGGRRYLLRRFLERAAVCQARLAGSIGRPDRRRPARRYRRVHLAAELHRRTCLHHALPPASEHADGEPDHDGARRPQGLYPSGRFRRPLVHRGIQPHLPKADGVHNR